MKLPLLAFFILLLSSGAGAQTVDALGTFTPYSLFGIGEIEKQGSAMNIGMGGIGVAVRNNRFINYLNPASITERDTLSFMMDVGMDIKNFYNKDNDVSSAYNAFNMRNIVITLPIYKKSALILGFVPISNIGYKFASPETDPLIVSKYGDIKYYKYGSGSVNKLFVGGALNIGKKLAVGVELIDYFGTLYKHSDVEFSSDNTIRTIVSGNDYTISAFSAKFGAQFFTPFANDKYLLTLGATYSIGRDLGGDITDYSYATDATGISVDTLYHNVKSNNTIKMPGELAVGFTIKRQNKWMVGMDYTYQAWKSTSFPPVRGVDFEATASHSLKVGVEYTPNMYDVRYYFKRVTYRAGGYYEKSYMKVNGKNLSAYGITLGCSLPISRLNNALNLAVDLGERGSLKDNMVRERYVQFIINVNIHDLWFIKPKYD